LVTREEIENIQTVDEARALIERDPLGVMFTFWDMENASAAETEAWERAIVDFAARERIKPRPFQYSCTRPPILQRKPWLDFGTCWPYCFARLDKHDACFAIPLGRNYKPLAEEQWPGCYYDYNEFAHTAWRFIDDPATLGDDIWTRVGPERLWLYNDDPASRRGYFARVGRLLALTYDPIKHLHMLAGAVGRDDGPPGASAALEAA
jgi:hypothetical protein